MADILDDVMSQPSTNFDQNFQSAIESIIEKAMKTTNANQLQYLLGDLSLYLQIAQHQQSEINVSPNSKHQLFNSTLSPLHLSYLSDEHQDELEQQVGYVSSHAFWAQLANIKIALSQGDLESAIGQLGLIIKQEEFTMLPHLNHLLLKELEDWIELQIALEE